VQACPSAGGLTPCLPDGQSCLLGVFTPAYSSFALDSYCLPSNMTNINLESLFGPDAFESWAYDLQTGWVLLAVSALAAILLSLLFLLFVRICAGFIIWLTAVVAIGGLATVGVFFILTAKGVVIDDFVYDNLTTLSYNTLIITGSISIAGAFLLFLLLLCLHSRVTMGAKAVELGSVFLLSNCGMVLLPVTQVFFILGTIAALIAGAGYLYSLGNFSFPAGAAFADVSLGTG
jgi:hypothetical protein